jgi:myo-inositol-1(or 4)-monophosphatase
VIDPPSFEACRDVARRAASAGGAVLMQHYRRVGYREKAPFDLVTEADVESQRAIAATLLAAFPDHTILAEEEGLRDDPTRPGRWIVDPLDGTVNFAHGVAPWCVSIGFEWRGRLAAAAIHVPLTGESFHAAHGGGAFRDDERLAVSRVERLEESLIATGFPTRFELDAERQLAWFRRMSTRTHAVRRGGSSAWNLAMVAAGGFDVCYASGMHPWDAAAGVLLIEEAGGRVTALDGGAFRLDSGGLLATNGRVHDAARHALSEAWPYDPHGPSDPPPAAPG